MDVSLQLQQQPPPEKRQRGEIQVFATVKPETKRALVAIAKTEKCSLSGLIRVILEEVVENSRFK